MVSAKSNDGDAVLLYRLQEVERRLEGLEEQVIGHGESFAELRGDIKEIKQSVSSLRQDVLTTIAKHTDRTWKLIFGLVAALIILAGGAQALKFLSV